MEDIPKKDNTDSKFVHQVIFDKEKNIISVEQKNDQPKETGKFGTSLLYDYQGYNFHPRAYHVLANKEHVHFCASDVLLTMYPKSGSTWLSECIWLISNQYDYDLALKDSIELRFPQIDSPSHDVFDLILQKSTNDIQGQLIKASIPPNLLIGQKEKPKVISIFRNPRDVLVSFYHHCRSVKHYSLYIEFNQFFDSFVKGLVPCGPIWKLYNDTFKYHSSNLETTLIIFYEDMKRDLIFEVEKICHFLDKPAPKSQEERDKLLSHLSVEKMRNNPTINRHDWAELGIGNKDGTEFVRKGQINDWKNFFNEEQCKIFDALVDKLVPELKERYK